jgi:hypothetical protein
VTATARRDVFGEARRGLRDAVVAELQEPPSISPSAVETVGLGYVVRFDQLGGATMHLRRIREAGGDLTGELVIEQPARHDGGSPVHLAWARFNLSSLHARGAWAKDLAARSVPARSADQWRAALDQFCLAVLSRHRQGQPTVLVGRNPQRERAQMVLAPLLREGLPTLVFAPGGTGKTTLAAAIAVAVETGAPILPGFRGQTGPVLVLDWETTSEDWADTVHAICVGAGIEPVDVRYRRMAGSLADQVEEVAELVSEHAIPLVVLDSVEAASGGEGEGFNERANRLFDAVRTIGASWLLLDHVKAEDLERTDGLRKPINGVMKVNRARAMFELRAEKEATRERIEVVLIDAKRNGRARLDPTGLAMCFDDFDDEGQAHAIHFEATAIEADDLAVAALTNPQRIARLLRSEAMKPAAIAEALGLKDNLVRSILAKGKGKRFVSLPDGRWGLAHA